MIVFNFKIPDILRNVIEFNGTLLFLKRFCFRYNIDGGLLDVTMVDNKAGHTMAFSVCRQRNELNFCNWDKCLLGQVYNNSRKMICDGIVALRWITDPNKDSDLYGPGADKAPLLYYESLRYWKNLEKKHANTIRKRYDKYKKSQRNRGKNIIAFEDFKNTWLQRYIISGVEFDNDTYHYPFKRSASPDPNYQNPSFLSRITRCASRKRARTTS